MLSVFHNYIYINLPIFDCQKYAVFFNSEMEMLAKLLFYPSKVPSVDHFLPERQEKINKCHCKTNTSLLTVRIYKKN